MSDQFWLACNDIKPLVLNNYCRIAYIYKTLATGNAMRQSNQT